jgi:hypothetical protein
MYTRYKSPDVLRFQIALGNYYKTLHHFCRISRNKSYGLILTCICLSRRLFRVILKISRAECNIDVTPGTLTATDTCVGYHVTRFEASRKVILHTRCVSTCVGAGGGRGRGTKIKKTNV